METVYLSYNGVTSVPVCYEMYSQKCIFSCQEHVAQKR